MDEPTKDRPLTRKYARIERERRFLLEALPTGVDPDDYDRLRDCFVTGTHLRLRRVERPDGTVRTTKLGQKIMDPAYPNSPRHRQMTTIYLPEAEAAALPLDGLRACKRRYKLFDQGFTFCIDVWETPEHAAGLLVAEVECPTDAELDAIRCPDWAICEVTADSAYGSVTVTRQGRPDDRPQ